MTHGFATEAAMARLFRHANIPTVSFDSLTLINIAKSSDIGKRRIELARPYLLSEYGHSVRKPDGTYKSCLHWEDVPPQVILDYIYGIDFVVNYKGWCIGIDVTANPDTLYDKQAKLLGLSPLWKAIGIDHTAVFHCKLQANQLPVMDKDAVRSLLRQVLKGEEVLTLAL